LELLQLTRIDGKEINEAVFDSEFAGNLFFMYKVIFFVIEVNYKDFFDKSGIGKILTQTQSDIPIPEKSSASSKTLKKAS
jgi:hypothetical protein